MPSWPIPAQGTNMDSVARSEHAIGRLHGPQLHYKMSPSGTATDGGARPTATRLENLPSAGPPAAECGQPDSLRNPASCAAPVSVDWYHPRRCSSHLPLPMRITAVVPRDGFIVPGVGPLSAVTKLPNTTQRARRGPHAAQGRYSSSNPWVVNFNVLLFSVTVRTI